MTVSTHAIRSGSVLAAALALALAPAAMAPAQEAGETRALPAPADLPPDQETLPEDLLPPEAAVRERAAPVGAERAREEIPPPPAKGKARAEGRMLKAAKKAPPHAARPGAEEAEEVPAPPPARGKAALVEQIRKRGPEAARRVEKATKGERPGPAKGGEKAAPKPMRQDSSREEGPRSRGEETGRSGRLLELLAALNPLYAEPAHAAGETFSVELTPQVDGSTGRHVGLSTSSPYAYAQVYGALVHGYDPSNDRIRLFARDLSAYGLGAFTRPYAYVRVNIPSDGWYIVNANLYTYGNEIELRHYEGSTPYTLVETFARQSGWADYPTLQYLEAGYHYFYYVLPGGGYLARLAVDSYP